MDRTARVTRKEHFSAAHRLFDPALDDAQNLERFGPCSNPGGHGHNYRMEVTVEGPIDEASGMVVDLGKLHRLVQTAVLDKVDHRNLNTEVDFLRGVMPTTENLARCIFRQLETRLPAGQLYRVRIEETDRNSAEYGR
jgi:6-pyruvoyltetrahydropterin/6-carboxytetrahydropterin synthase